MNNKVFVKILVPDVDKNFDVYLPINKKIGNIIMLLTKAIVEMTNGEIPLSNSNSLYNAKTYEKYKSDVLLYNTNIRNGSVLVLDCNLKES